ncbi:hypothetical protein [Paenibacillus sp. NPDC058071]|uniref:hypothetical protein n=1 Tax=Paenibacillus sp. NPDC058071 TaxID=3346326 RepID=UPI0036DD18A6
MDQEITVVLLEKSSTGELREIDRRRWSRTMIASLDHVNYLVFNGREYETLEGRLNVDHGHLELLLVPMQT